MKFSTIVLLYTVVALTWGRQENEASEELEIEKKSGALGALDTLVNAGELGIKLKEEAVKLFNTLNGATELKNRARSLELDIANGSKYPLRFKKEYFSSGTWYSSPKPLEVPPGGVTIGTVANRQGSWFTGVTGGMAWEIVGTGKYLIIGFTNPYIGSYKTYIGVRDQPDAEYGYNNSYDDSVKMRSENGFALIARLDNSELAQRKIKFAIGDE